MSNISYLPGVRPTTPTADNGAVRNKPPRRQRNTDLRPREWLVEKEVDRLMAAARSRGRYGYRDSTMILLAYRHGLRVSELCALRWDAVDLDQGLLHVRRVKKGTPSTHPLTGTEIRSLRRVLRESGPSVFVFVSERGAPLTPSGFRATLARIGEAAGFGWRVHPHQLRHACGYALANAGTDIRVLQVYLGHRNITHTAHYAQLSPDRFKGLWQD